MMHWHYFLKMEILLLVEIKSPLFKISEQRRLLDHWALIGFGTKVSSKGK